MTSSARAARRTSVSRWLSHLWRETVVEGRKAPRPAFARPHPQNWSNEPLTAAWLGHSTVLLNFFGLHILTDPVLFPRIGLRGPGFTFGPKRLTEPALRAHELPPIDLVLLSHAHFDHFDLRTLHHLPQTADVVTAPRTSDLLRRLPFHRKTELRWGEAIELERAAGAVRVQAFEVRHWGARMRTDTYRGYNGYLLERHGVRLLFGGDTAMTDHFKSVRQRQPIALALMAVGAYDPWIRAHANPEQAVAMAEMAGAEHIMPLHHQTFRLSAEPFREPLERFEAALQRQPHRIALREIGETFHLRP